ncbi:MAG: aspartate carbamoyltransferase regulatory subunit [Candidatus Limiplasma sp.]|nr:aspartate carbamoyltransferase regulatory subunit [Candidatus Limiplasma sp.]
MNIDGIQNGYVIDHIRSGRAMTIYRYLRLDKLDCSVAIIKNAKSQRMGRKDIIKIDALIPIDLDILGYIDPDVTINVIRDDQLAEKKHLSLPLHVVDVIRCKNPRCITQVEQEIAQEFVLTDRARGVYRCVYCETAHKNDDKPEF